MEHPEGYGIYFQERWDDAISCDPEFLYLNDWNEWTAGMWDKGNKIEFLRRPENPFRFIDQYNAEFNRTIQPMKGGYTDNYYMQMAENIRRYKGVRPIPVNKGFKKIAIDGSFKDWNKVDVTYRDTRGDVTFRDADGYGGLHYTDSTGRNDIQDSKVALTKAGDVCFYVKCGSGISPSDGQDWMLLLIDADQNTQTGWYGYDFIVNKKVVDQNVTTIMKYADGQWVPAAEIPYSVSGNEMEISIPAQVLGIPAGSVSFDFKWADNTGELVDPISLCLHGDTAPNRRFNYRFIFKK